MRFVPIPTEVARHYQAGAPDANGQVPERHISDGGGNPCRHCLKPVPDGAAMLILAHRPFPALQPYAELGPIFLCVDPCKAGGGEALPEMLTSPDYIVRGYGADDRIVYGTGGVVLTPEIPARAAALFDDRRVAYLHVRSSRNNCYQCRIDRGAGSTAGSGRFSGEAACRRKAFRRAPHLTLTFGAKGGAVPPAPPRDIW